MWIRSNYCYTNLLRRLNILYTSDSVE